MLKLILSIAGGLILIVLAVLGGYYATDGAVGATVTDKDCGVGPGATSEVTVTTSFPIPGVTTTLKEFDNTQCSAVTVDRTYAEYHLRSERTILYESEGGPCLYDSADKLC